ncbi:MAG: DPP IV N-terminal domain-containing protein [Candidatus Omnitrophica bacterium]|nr:DPP IV N-terminal domain-containing protein [Candidatus Omnitrophota bacterium]
MVDLFWIDASGRRQSYGSLQPGESREQHSYEGHVWLAADKEGKTLGVFECAREPGDAVIDGIITQAEEASEPSPLPPEGASPDGKWIAFCTDSSVGVRHAATGEEFTLCDDGSEDDRYASPFYWSPDSKKLAVMKIKKGEERTVYLIESSPDDQLQPKLHSYSYNKPGDQMPVPRPHLFDVEKKRPIPVSDELFPNAWSIRDIHWRPDSSEFMFTYNQRGHQVLRIVGVNAESGEARAIIDEQSKTFIDYAGKQYKKFLDDSNEIIWMSERDGWNHLYLYDSLTGEVKNQITRGRWVVRKVERVDVEKRQIWFSAGGVYPEQDPYYLHLCRVNFDGGEFIVLTQAEGTHQWEFSPNREYFIDSWSRVDQPPVAELRRSSDGSLICELERSDWSKLLEEGWRPPECFSAKARDGAADIYGIIFRPSQFDPNKIYPVIEEIYAGPHSSHVPKEFGRYIRQNKMAELGFFVVQIDGMGTSNRSKAFHDVCWKNLGDAGFPDRILWMKAAAQAHPQMDLSRVGIYGGSAGGQNALRALLAHGDFYKAAVADCGCHDNRMDKIWWNELWMGWPVGPHYEEQSNVTQAHRLKGKLLLIVGELDRNVDPASTMQVVDALIKADKDFDLLIIPGAGHGCAESPYGQRRRMDFFVRNLLNVEPGREN